MQEKLNFLMSAKPQNPDDFDNPTKIPPWPSSKAHQVCSKE